MEQLIFWGIAGFLAFGATVAVAQWALKVAGQVAKFLAKAAMVATGCFIAFGLFGVSAAEAQSLTIPAGSLVGAMLKSPMG